MRKIFILTIGLLCNCYLSMGKDYVITDYGVNSDSTVVQTQQLQQVIDLCAKEGGGSVVVPQGTFLTGALFFKAGTRLHLDEGARLKGIDDIRHYPLTDMHFEGLPVRYFAALVNADRADGFRISGSGTIDGNARRFWDEFWLRRKWNPQCTNLEALRPQLVYVSNSNDVVIEGVRLVNSAFWTTHLYRCDNVTIQNCHIESPTEGKTRAPSSDAIDLDDCDGVVVRGCYINTCDDGVCLKGGRGTFVDRDSTAGPVRRVLVEDCRFGPLTNAALTFGSDAYDCHDVTMRRCRVEGTVRLLLFKMRPDTPQSYGDVLVEDCSGSCYTAIEASTWSQFHTPEERPDMPVSSVSNVTLRNLDIKANRFFVVSQKHPFTLSHFTLEYITATDRTNSFQTDSIRNLKVKNVTLNGRKL